MPRICRTVAVDERLRAALRFSGLPTFRLAERDGFLSRQRPTARGARRLPVTHPRRWRRGTRTRPATPGPWQLARSPQPLLLLTQPEHIQRLTRARVRDLWCDHHRHVPRAPAAKARRHGDVLMAVDGE